MKFQVGGRSLNVTSLDKVLYPAAGTTKADVMHYYLSVADVMIPQIARRPVTRKRWPDGVEGESFFRKDLEESAPEWVTVGEIEHAESVNRYPLVDASPTLAWLAQVAALELHTPQWRFTPDGSRANPDRMVLDLDPGPGVSLAQTAEVALWCREILDGMGMDAVPVTSGSKGIHLYAALDGSYDSDTVSEVAKALARGLEEDHPERVTSVMRKRERGGKVFVDFSQNKASKTTVAPYSLRGRQRPMVAAPRTWEEIEDPALAHLGLDEVLARVGDGLDPIAALGAPARDKLATYRSMRDARKTPEPIPGVVPAAREGAPIFVIQEHHARRVHWDVRIERDGVLVSWAVPKGPPDDPAVTRLAVQTEDHPIEYATFEGSIPKGQYGAGEMAIWDTGTVDIEKWREGEEVIAVFHGRGTPRRYALIHTGGKNWLMKLMARQPAPSLAPMLAVAGSPADLTLGEKDGVRYAYEMKWDGYRIIAEVAAGTVTLRSRNGKDFTHLFPHAGELAEVLGGGAADGVLDGELVALDDRGRPDFSLLRAEDTGSAGTELRYMLFDALEIGGRSLMGKAYVERRQALEALTETEHVAIPPRFSGSYEAAEKASRALGLEGVMAKREDSPYLPGERSKAWLKLKTELHQEVVVVGVRTGKRAVSSLLVAVPDDAGELRYAGRVGTGFTAAQLDEIEGKLRRVERAEPAVEVPGPDAADAWWVEPRYVAEVKLAGRTRGGSVRQASWRGWRPDKEPDEVRWLEWAR
ncbi:ATP-dependent DNA ligase LigD ligase module /ATP-dependent DNA ligase LigD phosphoesterase module /ATP-dependent DNA ligase LigD polymerase module [Corynebacterium mycetoides]|uniref:DNA ligase (ATP) n=1 Tax=Corynebacterium mycetoides TaxID=38302 RepID=A0A1G9LP77_9CORY|nr:ATP-dependent DNA ligase [Corynebacterium mycetoides]SDL63541.1 ATP-dependent DNA ligase LigD ligase module /ATP-dependent DNA ligase LigD phosphoesterase module /ATP-dependent DNA ligase LigD polymerase module [Corynebacterium mycetoides]